MDWEVRGGKACGYRARLVMDEMMVSPSSAAYGDTFPLKGEGFLTLCEHGKYHFVLWFAFAIRPHPSPAATDEGGRM